MTDIRIDPAALTFPAGLPGFPQARRFALDEAAPETPGIFVLRAADDPGLTFVVAVPTLFFPDYAPEIDEAAAERLELSDPRDALVLVILSLPGDPALATANLLGPLLVNLRTARAAQIAVPEDRAPSVKTPLQAPP